MWEIDIIMRLKALLLLSLLVSFNLFAQTDHETLPYSVSGTVVESENGHPLQYVTVTLSGLKYATVTNSEGGFIIKSATKPQSVEFNLLGFKTASIPFPEDGSPVTVRMERNKLTLNEAIVISGDPYTILYEAMKKIKVNYPAQAELFDCFYRETVQKRNRYIYISEAVAQMLKTSYSRGSVIADRIAIRKSRVLTSPSKRDTLSVKVVGGPAQAVEFDIVKNNELLNVQELSKYTFEMDIPELIGDRMQFAIRLIPNVVETYPLYEGVIYVDRETLAFTRFDLSLDMRDKDKVTGAILLKKPAGLRFTPTEVSFRYDYTLSEGVSRVSYVGTKLRFKCDWKRRFIRTDFTAISELVTTDRHSDSIELIPRKESFNSREALSDVAAQLDYDSEFWKDYNIIEPTESLDRAITKIVRQNAGN